MADHEPSYYEIVLTNRQALVSFVVLLGSVLVAFAMGVWVGRMDQMPLVAAAAPVAESPAVEPGDLDGLEEFRFPSDGEDAGNAELDKPALSQLRGNPAAQWAAPPCNRRDTTLAHDVGSQRPSGTPSRTSGAPPPPPPPLRTAPPRTAPPPPASPPRHAAPPAAQTGEGFIIQVFSTYDEGQANKLRERLIQNGHRAFVTPVQVGDQATKYRVRIGLFSDRSSAEKAAAKVRSAFPDLEAPWVTAASN